MNVDAAEAIRRVGLDPDDFVVAQLSHNKWLTSGIWTVASGDRRMVVKCLAKSEEGAGAAWDFHWKANSDDPRRWNYWAREAVAYRSGLVNAYESSGIVAPELLAIDERDDEIVLLLEFVEGPPSDGWSIDDYARAARQLGSAQAGLIVIGGVPAHEWLSRRFLREYSSEKPVDWSLLQSDEAWSQALVRRNFPREVRESASWVHSNRERLYSIQESLPRTLCHLDFWTKNLLRRDDGNLVLIDWAFVGDGAIGEDIGNLVPDAAMDHFLPASSLPELAAATLHAYVDGAHDAGWDGDPRLIELGMCASAVKYNWLTPRMLESAGETKHLRYGGTEEVDADYRFKERGLALLHNARNAQRAVELAQELGL